MTRTSRYLYGIAAFFLMGLILTAADLSMAQEDTQDLTEVNATDFEVPEWITRPVYQYSAAGKQDPFSSFLKAKATQKERDPRELSRLGPLERLQVTQMKLVGVIANQADPDKTVAMVELPDGKGFMVKKGQKLGLNRGRVVSITRGQLRVMEEVENIFGDIENKTVVLKLHSPQGDGNE